MRAKKLLSRFLLSYCLMALTFCGSEMNAQVRVSKVSDPSQLTGKKGIFYSLPRTKIHINLGIVRTEQIAGPLAEYAKEMLGIDKVVEKNMVTYAIDHVAIMTESETDPEQLFLVEKEEKAQGEVWIAFGKREPVVALEKFDKASHPDGFTPWNGQHIPLADPQSLFRKYTDSPVREVIDTIVRKVSIDTLVMVDMICKRTLAEFSDLEKAQEAAARIRQIEQDQYNLLIGYQETAYSIESLQFMYDKLEELRLEYLKLFTGLTLNTLMRYDLPVVPSIGEDDQAYTLGGFSKSSGLVEAEGQNAIILKLISSESALSDLAKKQESFTGGIAYRLPVKVKAAVFNQGKELVSKEIEVLQLGPVISLPSEFKRVEFDTETGNLRSVIIE